MAKKIGYVSQSIFIMDSSIEENIAFGIEPEKIDKKLLEYALKSANLIELNQKLNNSTNSRVGENGVTNRVVNDKGLELPGPYIEILQYYC